MTDFPLYPSEAQIARKVLGPNRLDEWKGLVEILEREGFPPIKPRYGGRYWPACEHWFQVENRLVSIAPGRFGKEDGGETCPEPRTSTKRDLRNSSTTILKPDFSRTGSGGDAAVGDK